eukprot:2417090-Prymnesium_polylepis.1
MGGPLGGQNTCHRAHQLCSGVQECMQSATKKTKWSRNRTVHSSVGHARRYFCPSRSSPGYVLI